MCTLCVIVFTKFSFSIQRMSNYTEPMPDARCSVTHYVIILHVTIVQRFDRVMNSKFRCNKLEALQNTQTTDSGCGHNFCTMCIHTTRLLWLIKHVQMCIVCSFIDAMVQVRMCFQRPVSRVNVNKKSTHLKNVKISKIETNEKKTLCRS